MPTDCSALVSTASTKISATSSWVNILRLIEVCVPTTCFVQGLSVPGVYICMFSFLPQVFTFSFFQVNWDTAGLEPGV